ncbi:MAG: hypothetical protein CVU56_27555 [Deltaproteobacteria bacterium HGW-Deltaproteobacteria-14]|jgi:hypothetical protein|nr:MAG: hypothetical protein CVU56_27555 [Deltaproteobacteria bacterium HGW-Deltaproteobacteria-14]
MRATLLTLLGSACYATVRYNGYKGVPWGDWPTYTLNKVFAVAAVALLLVAALRRRRAGAPSTAPLLAHAAALTALHVTLSLMLLSPTYFPGYFAAGKLTAAAGAAMTLGAIAVVWMARGRVGPRTREDRARGGLALLAGLIAAHTAIQGGPGWLTPETWPGGMPPITLLGTLLALVVLAVTGRARRPATRAS